MTRASCNLGSWVRNAVPWPAAPTGFPPLLIRVSDRGARALNSQGEAALFGRRTVRNVRRRPTVGAERPNSPLNPMLAISPAIGPFLQVANLANLLPRERLPHCGATL